MAKIAQKNKNICFFNFDGWSEILTSIGDSAVLISWKNNAGEPNGKSTQFHAER